jgi:ParB-like chromosome segregation protein Spo0J
VAADLIKGGAGQRILNIRYGLGDLDELRDSMRTFGWLAALPAIADETGMIIVGKRRLKVAEELNITPVITRITFGQGDEADAKRVKLALASNLGGAPLSPADRVRIAENLYGEKGWTMQRIADALAVSKKTISKDLKDSVVTRVTIPDIPKVGRPKGTPNPPSSKAMPERQGASPPPPVKPEPPKRKPASQKPTAEEEGRKLRKDFWQNLSWLHDNSVRTFDEAYRAGIERAFDVHKVGVEIDEMPEWVHDEDDEVAVSKRFLLDLRTMIEDLPDIAQWLEALLDRIEENTPAPDEEDEE